MIALGHLSASSYYRHLLFAILDMLDAGIRRNDGATIYSALVLRISINLALKRALRRSGYLASPAVLFALGSQGIFVDHMFAQV